MKEKDTQSCNYKIGYALSGGFIKGFAHLGAIQALMEHDIKPNIISGVSAGALSGVFIADGRTPREVVDIFMQNKFSSLTSWAKRSSGLYSLETFIKFLQKNLRTQRLEDLEIPLIVTATDFDHGISVHFNEGNIAERIAASCCMPIVFSPVQIDETHYVDGGLFNNLPVSIIREHCEKIVGINVSPLIVSEYKQNILSIAKRAYDFIFQANTFHDRALSDLLIEPYNLQGYSNRELDKADEIFEQGYNTANEVLKRLIQEQGSIWKKEK
jgi:NTE family protein